MRPLDVEQKALPDEPRGLQDAHYGPSAPRIDKRCCRMVSNASHQVGREDSYVSGGRFFLV